MRAFHVFENACRDGTMSETDSGLLIHDYDFPLSLPTTENSTEDCVVRRVECAAVGTSKGEINVIPV